jgi:hypothetical protein
MSAMLKLTVAVILVAGAVAGGVLVTRGDASHDSAGLSNPGGPTIAIRGLRMKLARRASASGLRATSAIPAR